MGPPSYMRSVIDRNVFMQCMTVFVHIRVYRALQVIPRHVIHNRKDSVCVIREPTMAAVTSTNFIPF
jgi:hypothetical protein